MHGNIIGSYVVFDPTGRDARDCFQVGRVIGCCWNTDADDGTEDGYPRPLLYVVPNGEDDPVCCTYVNAVLWAPDEDGDEAPHAIRTARKPEELTDAFTVVFRLETPMAFGWARDYVGGLARTLGATFDIHAEDLTRND
jgi:hypothetical protein